MNAEVALVVSGSHLQQEGQRLATRLSLPLLNVTCAAQSSNVPLLLVLDDCGLELRLTGQGAPGPVKVDFGDRRMRHRRRSGANELLGRAVGVRGGRLPAVLDANAGLARDGFVLADLGCRVFLCERLPVVAVMLEQALQRAADSSDSWLQQSSARMQLLAGDCRDVAAEVIAGIDTIYLDPMFPLRKKSAQVKKEMVVLQALAGTVSEEEPIELLHWALAQPVGRVVVKRPARSSVIGDLPPTYQLNGKSVRFDVYQL